MKPISVKRLEGNVGKRRIPKDDEYVHASGALIRPEHITGYAAEVWDRVIASMPPGLYGPPDAEALVAYCDAAETLRDAREHLAAEGQVLETNYGPKRNPWGPIAGQARQQIKDIGTRLGLDPIARERMSQPSGPGKSKFSGLAAIGGSKKA
jgi:P27 family predicted phage terminase small subunit